MPKADRATILSRIDDTMRLLLAGAEFADVRQYAAQHNWEVCDRHVRRYIEKAYKRLEKAGNRDRRQLLGRHLMQRRVLYARCLKGGDVRAALQVSRDEANLLGLYKMSDEDAETASTQSYGKPIELAKRLPMVLAAEARDDEEELNLLAHAAPMKYYRMSDTDLPALYVDILALIYITEQLDYAASYYSSMWRLELSEQLDEPPTSRDPIPMLSLYLFKVHRDGWDKFTQEVGFDGDALVRGNYHGHALALCEGFMCEFAPTAEEVVAAAKECGRELSYALTADDVAASWQRLYERCLRR